MRAGLSTIQQTLAPEAASVLTSSIAEAAKRNHGQTTPLHVAATLLSSPGGLLRQACVRSHPNSSHPLQCRALELCFSVALDRLPSANPSSSSSSSSPAQPPISNALMAALKRAQAHQRRGCPEQQQSPLLAVKVDLEQFVVSILDDPSVSRVMKEASFSSPAVKASIEQSLPPPPPPSHRPTPATAAPRNNLYLNPRLQQQQQKQDSSKPDGGSHRKEEVNKVVEILTRAKKHNPVLVGDSDLNSVTKEVMERIKTRELGCSPQIISLEEEFASLTQSRLLPSKIRELRTDIDARIGSGSSVVVDLGDLKWLVESGAGASAAASGPNKIQQQQATSEAGRAAVAEMADIVKKFREAGAGGGRVWLIGTATCATYLRCQVYHPDMESEWDLQALPIAPPRSALPGLFPRLGNTHGILSSSFGKNGILSSSVEALASPMVFPPTKQTTVQSRRPSETAADTSRRQTLSPQCRESYERELSKLVADEFEKSPSASRPEPSPALPKWLQIAPPSASKESELNYKQSMEEQLKQWRRNCSPLRPNSSNPRVSQPNLSLAQGLAPLQTVNLLDQPASPPRSPVKTDLVLGNSNPPDTPSSWEKAHRDSVRGKKDGLSDRRSPKLSSFEDADSIKRLFKGLNEKVGWQSEAASAITSAIMQSKAGNGKRRGVMPKGDTWLLFVGPDKVGKRKMAVALSELVFGTPPVVICLGSPRTDGDDGESDINFRGKMPLDRVASAIRQNPFSVIVLENIDQADAVVRGTIKQAINKGRLPDSYGKEVSLGSAIFVLTTNWLPDELKSSMEDSVIKMEEKILSSANCSWQLELSIRGKRQPEWLSKLDQPEKRRKETIGLGLSLDLNLAAGGSTGGDEDGGESSLNSSDITVENDNEHGRLAIQRPHSTSSASEFIDSVDNSVVFKPVDFGPMRRSISESISAKFASVVGAGRSVQVDDDVLDQMVGSVWLSGVRFEEWAERVLVPCIEQLRGNLCEDDDRTAIRLTKTSRSSSKLLTGARRGGPEIVCRKVSHWQ